MDTQPAADTVLAYNTPNGNFVPYENDYIITGWLRGNHIFDESLVNKCLKNIIKKSKHILDIGANIGCHAVSYAKFNPNASIIAFEPQKEIFEKLCINKQINNLDNLVCANYSVGHVASMVSMNPPLQTPDGTNYAGTGLGEGGEQTQMITIDSLNLPGVDFIKMDVQGSEGLVIMGARETIRKYKPTIFFEHDDTHVKPEHVGLENIPTPFFELVALGYNTFTYLGEHNYITHWDPECNFVQREGYTI